MTVVKSACCEKIFDGMASPIAFAGQLAPVTLTMPATTTATPTSRDLSTISPLTPFVYLDYSGGGTTGGAITMPTASPMGRTFMLSVKARANDSGTLTWTASEFLNFRVPSSLADGKHSLIQFVVATDNVQGTKWVYLSEATVI